MTAHCQVRFGFWFYAIYSVSLSKERSFSTSFMKRTFTREATTFGLLMWLYTQALSQSLPSPSTLFRRQLTFGSGGGFSGTARSYVLHENGDLWVRERATDSLKLHKTLREKQTKQFFQSADQLQLDKYKFNHPGNVYYFVEYSNPKKRLKQKITWGAPKQKVSVYVQRFYNQLTKTI